MRSLLDTEMHLTSGTSFHRHTVTATPNQIQKLLGPPVYECNDGSDKVNMEWNCMTDTNKVFTIYDWKYYRPLGMDEPVEWHIGGKDTQSAYEGMKELKEALTK